ncbi:phosphoesterase RecJ-like protein [Bacillus mesophilus]|uniref:Bifunctional oligoribonuclease/PAP phosphatase NrnA n=1 Tax=Bacillus mesophilus TaxID=1808955 RepID=A0A6M0Q6G4_9BACI|nr:bifunctional oligoribonuclease/PAP phosphatase NrnA [Bacillus mesophilus]MBM7660555.1 phosphoesterase RecJ-like protein [Bacillus mesophilus]NEY71897.1 bifunctional oligoribonuclease/PAP phosphatase NrnA [Bacillus mesophilus]
MKEQILAAIERYDCIIIHRHVRPDPDAYGSQCGLAEILRASFPKKEIFVVGRDEEALGHLYKMDIVPDEVYEEALVIVCDTANQERVCDQRYKLGNLLIKIDHHPNEDSYGDLLWVDTTASSVSEMIYEFYLFGKNQGLVLTQEGARLIFAGIVGDTGRFLFPSTNTRTFKYAGELVEYGFELPTLYEGLYTTKVNVAHLTGYVLQNFTLSSHGVATMLLTKDILEKFDVTPTDASQLVGSLGNIEGIITWVFFVEEDDQIRVRLRSKGPVINVVAAKYRGGGHPLAAGASVHSWEEANEVIKDLEELCTPK